MLVVAVLSGSGKAVGIVKIEMEVALVEAGKWAVKVGASVEGSKVSNGGGGDGGGSGIVEVFEVVEVSAVRKMVMI